MRSSAALVVVLLALLAAGPAVAAIPAAAEAPLRSQDLPDEEPNTTITIDVQSNGDARWTVTNRFTLDDESEAAAFEQLADDFESGRLNARFSTGFFEALADGSSDRTGRDMTITNVERTSDATNESGQLTLEFTWTNFARVEDGTMTLGDVFRTESGIWLSSLSADQRLVIEPPQGYAVSSTPQDVGVDDGRIVLDGPYTVDGDEFVIEYEQGRSPGSLGLADIGVAVLLLMAMGVGGIGVYVWTRREREENTPGDTDETVPGPISGAHGTRDVEATEPDEPGEDEDDAAEDLLSDEERVERLIERNGGRMMQANIVKETGWSNAKVSQLLSAMDENERINKLRIGRENLITLPDEDVTDPE